MFEIETDAVVAAAVGADGTDDDQIAVGGGAVADLVSCVCTPYLLLLGTFSEDPYGDESVSENV